MVLPIILFISFTWLYTISLFLLTNTYCSLSLPPCRPLSHSFSDSECLWEWCLLAGGWTLSRSVLSCLNTQAHCLHTGVMDSVATDTTHISLSSSVLGGWTIIAHICTAMVNTIHGTKRMAQNSTVGKCF